MPHLLHVGLATADPDRHVPIGFWMHRGCVPFVSPAAVQNVYWPTVKPIIEELWAHGHQTLFYAEGKWDHHLESFAELPGQSIVYHVDQGDIFKAHRALGDKFCLSGGMPNVLLGFGPPDDVRDYCQKVIDGVARDGGYIMDASAIVQNDTKVENLRAMTESTREYGIYPGAPAPTATPPCDVPGSRTDRAALRGLDGRPEPRVAAGVCVPWEEKARELPPITGNRDLVRAVWERVDLLGNDYIWQLLLSF